MRENLQSAKRGKYDIRWADIKTFVTKIQDGKMALRSESESQNGLFTGTAI